MIYDLVPEYYLHRDGDLIYKPQGGTDRKSPFVVKVWTMPSISRNPRSFLDWLIELEELGVVRARILSLGRANSLEKHFPDWQTRVFGTPVESK